jgi:hypothetical protein
MGNPPGNRTKAHRFIPQSAFIGNGPWGTSKQKVIDHVARIARMIGVDDLAKFTPA